MNRAPRKSPKPKSNKQKNQLTSRKSPAGGAATGGGMNFQAVVTVIAGVHLLRGTPISWLSGVTKDVPTAVWAETGGPGDDVRIDLTSGDVVEIQAKKGLGRGLSLWRALLELARAISSSQIQFGVLAVAPDSSGPIRTQLSQDIRRLGDGRQDPLSKIGVEFKSKLRAENLDIAHICARLRIVIVHGLEDDHADIRAVKESLQTVCTLESRSDGAWNTLYRDAHAIIERRGRWTLEYLINLLGSEGFGIRDGRFPAAIASSLAKAALRETSCYSLPGLARAIPLGSLLPFRTVNALYATDDAGDIVAAVEKYRGSAKRQSHKNERVFRGEWTGRFFRHAVVVAGPGLGKSTLATKLANVYAADGLPVLKIALKFAAASMRGGSAFDDALLRLGLDSSGISLEDAKAVDLPNWVVIADGLDECAEMRSKVAKGLARFAVAYPQARIVVTTRPIGYDMIDLADWRHYVLLAPEEEKGASNLATLMNAAGKHGDPKNELVPFAQRELSKTAASSVISGSPQLLAIAASLLVKDGTLPQSRPKLYDRMIALLGETPRAAELPRDPDRAITNRILEILGNTWIKDPLAHLEDILRSCAEEIAPELERSTLLARTSVDEALCRWEEVGLVEELHHGGTTLLAFIHNTFAEFAAAKYLRSYPKQDRRYQIDRIMDNPAFSEVLSFAGGLGSGDDIVKVLVGRHSAGQPGQFARALALISDRNAEISDQCAAELVTAAFTEIDQGQDKEFEIGVALADLAERMPKLVSPYAKLRQNNPDESVRLIAWACLAAANELSSDFQSLVQALREILSLVKLEAHPAKVELLLGKSNNASELIVKLAITALEAAPKDDLQKFVETELNHPALQTFGFMSKIHAILRKAGVENDTESQLMRLSPQMVNISPVSTLKQSSGWLDTSRSMLRALAEAVSDSSQSAGTATRRDHILNFNALIHSAGFYESEASDIHTWTRSYDPAPVRETLRLFTIISGINPAEVRLDAIEVIKRLDADESFTLFSRDFDDIDVPEASWSAVSGAQPNLELLAGALAHGSRWLAFLAAKMLEHLSITEGEARLFLDTGRGIGLAIAAKALSLRDPSRAHELIFERLEGTPVEGLEHLYAVLQELMPKLDKRLEDLIYADLTASRPEVAEAAAYLAADMASRGEVLDKNILTNAYEYWKKKEEPINNTMIKSSSPREGLLRVMLILEMVDTDDLNILMRDPHRGISRVATEALKARS